ncbi:unnamed protein product [Lactuca saligna]|uniref:Glycosyl hydrolase family 38 C-terminal domain-containing protein n=1 Tax=Lactuca saligna TaxID=75948 RepID=A0AA35VWX1_LACSI|nr:unnamed protein product [Lactuca saligna]
MIAKVAIVVVGVFLGWIYTRIKPPPPRVFGSPGGPPITSPRIQLNDGRHLPYREWGVPKDKANYKIIAISYCPPTETNLSSGKKLVVVVYNSRGWKRSDVIRLPVSIILASVPPLGFTTYVVSSTKKPAWNSVNEAFYKHTKTGKDGIEVGTGNLKLIYSGSEGKVSQYVNSRSSITASVKQSYNFYAGFDGTTREQASGAYIFHPNGTYSIDTQEQTPIKVLNGPIYDEVHQKINPCIYQITRVFKNKEHVEVEFTVGPIPVDDGVGKEMVTQITTTMKSNKTFYIDSNGRDFIQRIRDYREDWNLEVNQPIAGNYYPVNLGIYLKDETSELSFLVDRSVGGSSIVDGKLELMLHRRLLYDDGKGVAEVLNETVYVGNDCRGLTVSTFSGMDSSYSLPDNVALLTLQVLISISFSNFLFIPLAEIKGLIPEVLLSSFWSCNIGNYDSVLAMARGS